MPSIRWNVLPEKTRHTRVTIHIAYSKCRRSHKFKPMDTCVGCRIIEYLLSTVFLLVYDLGPICGRFNCIVSNWPLTYTHFHYISVHCYTSHHAMFSKRTHALEENKLTYVFGYTGSAEVQQHTAHERPV